MNYSEKEINRLIELSLIQRAELKNLVDSLPQLKTYLSSEIERNLEELEPAIRNELEEFVVLQSKNQNDKSLKEFNDKADKFYKTLENSTQAKYAVLLAEKSKTIELTKLAENKIQEKSNQIPLQVASLVEQELSKFPVIHEIQDLRKEFATPATLNPRGRWSPDKVYDKLDVVTINGSSFVANITTNTKPSMTSPQWTLLAARGNGGGIGLSNITDLTGNPRNGELLIGDGKDFQKNTLSAGSGITITNGSGTVTIAATGGGGGSGTVTSVSVTTANGVSGTVATATTTPAISLSLGAITPTSVNSVVLSGSSTPTLTVTGTSSISGSNTGDQTNITGNSATATKLSTGRTIAITGDVTYTSPSFDGSANVTAAGTVTKINGTALSGLATGILKNTTSTGVPSIAVSGTDYAPATSGSSILAGNASGGFSAVTVGSGLSYSAGTLSSTSGGGSVTSVSVVSANGLAGTVATSTSTPAITLTTSVTGILKGNGTAISAATSGTDYSSGTSALTTGILKSTTSTGALSIAVAGDFPTLNQNTTGNAANITGIAAVANGGTGASTLTGYVYGNGTSAFTASTTIPTTALSGTVTNAQLANSAITIAGSSTSLGGTISQDSITGLSGSTSIIYHSAANTLSNVTVGTGLSFASGTLSATAASPTSYHSQTDSGAGTVAVAPTGQISTEYVTTTASSSTTRNVTIARGSLTAGAIVKIRFSNSSNGSNVTTYNVYDTSTAGTLLTTFQVDQYTLSAYIEAVYTGSAFLLMTTIIPASGNNP